MNLRWKYLVVRKKCCNFARHFRIGSTKSGILTILPPHGLTFNCFIFIMYAIVEIQGQQFKAEAGKYLYVHYLGDEVKEGETKEFDKVLLVDADGAVKVGAPTVEGAKVVGEVKRPLVKGERIIVFKKKRRKGYRVRNGHRQCFTQVVIKDVIA